MQAHGFLEVDPATGRTSEVRFGSKHLPFGDRSGATLRFGLGNLSVGSALSTFFRRLFVPTGRVSPEYGRFQLADSIQATCSYLRGILSVHATLTGAGIGAAAAAAAATSDGTASSTAGAAAIAALAAVITLVLKDGCGMIGSLLFSYLFSHRFDSELRFWRLFADIINDIGLTVELLAPLTGPQLFVPVTCAANVCKALCGVAAGATRVSLAKHFALDGASVAEVQAKEGAQETAVTLLGLCLGLLCSSYLNSSLAVQWTAFIALTLLHVAANYYGVRILRLRTLNRTRLAMLARLHHAAAGSKDKSGGASGDTDSSRTLGSLAPAAIAELEPVLPSQYARRFVDASYLGSEPLLSLLCCSPRFASMRCEATPPSRSGSLSAGRTGSVSAGRPTPQAAASTVTPTSLRQWLDVWECEPCSIEVGVSAAQLVQLAKQAAAGDAESQAGARTARAADDVHAADAAMLGCIARVSLTAQDASSSIAYLTVLHSLSRHKPRVAIALPPSATPKMVAAAYLGVLAWADSACGIATPAVRGEGHRDAATLSCSNDSHGPCLVGSVPAAFAGSNAAAALAIARSIAATVRAVPAFLSTLLAAGWEVEDAGGFSLAEGGLRLTLLESPQAGARPEAVPAVPAVAAAAAFPHTQTRINETATALKAASGGGESSRGAGGAAQGSLRKRRHSPSPAASAGSK